ncbi:MAG: sn-glycerol-3-phosphate transporter [Casimicrobiaceae bacterium]
MLCAFPASVAHAQSAAPPADASLPSVWSAPEPWRTDRFFFVTSAKTWHFSYDPAHVDKQDLVLIEWNVTETWLVGASSFKNSFGQPSQFVYGGYRWRPFDAAQPLYFKLAVGLVHGYSGQYQNKIPFNNSGVAPAIVPSVGYCINRFCSELVLFGGAGAMINVGVTIP